MKKICTHCGEERDAEQDFNWKHKDRGIRHVRCKYCQSQVSKRHYEKNKQLYLDRARTREVLVIEDNQKRLAEYLQIQVGKTASGNGTDTGKHLTKDEQPQSWLHRTRQQLSRVVAQLTHFHFSNGKSLLHKTNTIGQWAPSAWLGWSNQAAERCAAFLQFHDSFLLIPEYLPRSE
jgi:hypothetical protein